MAADESSTGLRVLVVDDEKEVADAYALRLRGFCETETAYGGEAALAAVEDETFDVVLLDRHMPGLSGDEVLRELDDRDFPGRVVMVTAVDPQFDVIEMPFDDYLCKPVDREDVRAAVDQQRRVLAYEMLGEYFSAESKRAVLESGTAESARASHDGYEALSERAATLEARAKRLLDDPTVVDSFDDICREEL
ncbi:response regulator [Halobacterium rubrum]|uniref:response regulator n=1 Tax=Halobacterium TaxID=2239 RepID=UPI001F02CBD4|nr:MULTISPECIES: response regulator [Halobacterium]MDH5020565.1 response regulator [Halobacterium rubrum]